MQKQFLLFMMQLWDTENGLSETGNVALLRCPIEGITKLVKDDLANTRKETICVCTLYVGG